jgi:predicted transcriptional regulator
MKTAISVPDRTFHRIDERAQALGLSRSEFITRAAEDYLSRLDEEDLTDRINEALARGGAAAEAESSEFAVAASSGLAALTDGDDW